MSIYYDWFNFCVGEHTHFFYPSLEDFVWFVNYFRFLAQWQYKQNSILNWSLKTVKEEENYMLTLKFDIIQESNGSWTPKIEKF